MNRHSTKHLAAIALLIGLSACSPTQTPVSNGASPNPSAQPSSDVSVAPLPNASVIPGPQTSISPTPSAGPSISPSTAPTISVPSSLPLAPRQLQIVRREATLMTLSWEIAETRPHTYQLLLDGKEVAAELTGTSYTFTGLQADKSYRLEVRTVINGQTSLPNDIVGNTLVQGSTGTGGFGNGGGSTGNENNPPVPLVPTLDSLTPASGPANTVITLSGSNFDLTPSNNLVRFGTTPATVTAATATSLTVSVPAGLITGTNQVSVSINGQTTNTLPYQFLVPPVITSLSPLVGPVAGGTILTITGSDFTDTIGVNFGTLPATSFTVDSATTITATAPAQAAGSVDVSIMTPGGTSANTSADDYTYQAAPTLTSLSPTAGPIAGGTSVTLTGTNFTGVTAVSFGSVAATSFTVNSTTSITAISPAQAAGSVDIIVTTAGGTSANTAADNYTYVATPTITGLNPTSGSSAGGTSVTITGTNLTGTTAVNFGTVAATSFTVNSATSITAIAPAQAAGSVDVSVTTTGGTSANTASDNYTYVAAPAITSLSPTSGSTAGGTSVTITGSNFTGATAVNFGSTAATAFIVNSATSITAVSPAQSASTVDVRVITSGGTSANTASDNYTYQAPLAITSLSPATQSIAGGNTVTITGTGFTGATAVTFGSTAATSFTVVSNTSITAVAPTGSSGTVNVSVTGPTGTSTNVAADDYTYTQGRLYVSTLSRQLSFAPASSVSGSASAVTTINLSAAIQSSVDVPRNLLYVAVAGNNSIAIFDNAHRTSTAVRTLTNVGSSVRGVAIDTTRDILYVTATTGTIRIFDNASTLDGDMTGIGRTVTGGIVFGELSLDAANNRLFIGNDSASQNQVVVFDNASSMSGTFAAIPKRVITGPSTLFSHPLSLHYQASTDKLYVANFSGSNNVVVIANASTANGDYPAVQVLAGANTGLAQASGITINPITNELIVGSGNSAKVGFFSNADTVTGNIAPVRSISITGNPRGLTIDTTR